MNLHPLITARDRQKHRLTAPGIDPADRKPPPAGFIQAWEIHAAVMTTVTIAAVLAFSFVTPGPGILQTVLLVVSVALFGVPHGALDLRAARPYLRPFFRKLWLPVFFITYIAGVGLVLYGWYAASAFTLIAFLLLSVYHFGEGDVVHSRYDAVREAPLLIVWRGLIVIGIPIVHHSAETTRIFATLLTGVSKESLIHSVALLHTVILPIAVILCLVSFSIALRPAPPEQRKRRLWDAFESVTIAALFWVTPPLIAFLVYFCGWHSLRHTLHLAFELGDGKVGRGITVFARYSLPLTVVTLVSAAFAYFSWGGAHLDIEAKLLRLVFYGLSALTFPHMILVAWSRNPPPSPFPS